MQIRIHIPQPCFLLEPTFSFPFSLWQSKNHLYLLTAAFLQGGLYLAVAAGVAGLAGAGVVVDPVHAGRLVQARALRALVNVVLAIRP